MANAKIDIVDPKNVELISSMYGQIFKPAREAEFFRRRFRGRYNILTMVASMENREVGFYLGFELKPTVFFTWLIGVMPDCRRQGIASQLLEAAEAWSKEHEYTSIRMECHNQMRPLLHMGVRHMYDIVGIRWDPDRGDNLVILEKLLDH